MIAPRRGGRLVVLALAGALAACSHTDPFESPDHGSDGPFVPGNPARLTYAPTPDVSPAWLPDGSAFLYSLVSAESRAQADRCLGWMGANGGTLQRVVCEPSAAGDLRTDRFEAPAVSPGGRLAYTATVAPRPDANPTEVSIRIASVVDPLAIQAVRRLPFSVGGHTYIAAASLGWAGEDRLVLRGMQQVIFNPCIGCPPLVLQIGRDVLTLDVASGTVTAVPGTEFATSAAATADAVYFTLPGDSRVYRVPLAGGTPTVVRDFGPLGVARDVSVAGNLLAVIVGGEIQVMFDPAIGAAHLDQGGQLRILDLTTGVDEPLDADNLLFRNPALSPAGDRIVAEGSLFVEVPIEGPNGVIVGVDTVVTGGGDLWLLTR